VGTWGKQKLGPSGNKFPGSWVFNKSARMSSDWCTQRITEEN
jgi:hypothetical protein